MTIARGGSLSYRIRERTLIIDLGCLHRIVSSAPHGGGIVRARSILNRQVPADPLGVTGPFRNTWGNPGRDLGRLARRLKAMMPVVGLMTAVPMKQLVVDREQAGLVWVQCFCTVGVTNAVRAGERPPSTVRHRDHGTINIILVTNATLTMAALVGAVQVVTESKTGILMQNRVMSTAHKASLATGTGTDAVVIATSLDGIHKMPYSGTHTEIGSMIGRLVSRCVHMGLIRSTRWARSLKT